MGLDKRYMKVKISRAAYDKIKYLSEMPEYRGRGMIGVIDEKFVGEFTTSGSGRPANKTSLGTPKGD